MTLNENVLTVPLTDVKVIAMVLSPTRKSLPLIVKLDTELAVDVYRWNDICKDEISEGI